MTAPRHVFTAALCAGAMLLGAVPAWAAPGDPPLSPLPAGPPAADDKVKARTTSLPARGLFVGDQLSESAKSKLTDLIIDVIGMNVQVALLVPVGPWQIDGASHTDRSLTEARLGAVRRYLAERGVDAKRIFVESRIDAKLTEPRLDVQLVGQTAND